MSARLPLPVRRVLRDPMSPEAIEQLVARPRRSRRSPSAGWALSAAAVVVLGIVVRLAWPSPGPLMRADGTSIGEDLVASTDERVVLDDGSVLELAQGASLSTLDNGTHELSFLLERGTVTFDVVPHGPRRWTLECGLATVVVVGTRFTISRSEAQLRVSVERGVVLVRGELVPDHARRLEAGEEIVVSELADEREVAIAAPTSPAIVAAVEAPAPLPSAPSWRALAAETRWDDAFRALGPGGVPRASAHASVEDLLTLADVARLSGHLADAVSPLERIVNEHPGDPRASLAAFSLGRIEDQLGDPARAARAFDRALTLGQLPDALRSIAITRRDASLERVSEPGAELP